MNIPPKGQRVEFSAMNMDRIVNGKLAEKHIIFDALDMMQQLGVIPPPEQAEA
jgi:predicted ester cyclase